MNKLYNKTNININNIHKIDFLNLDNFKYSFTITLVLKKNLFIRVIKNKRKSNQN